MTKRALSSLIFDLDGTLVDTAPDLIGALNFVLSENGLEAIDAASVRPLVGLGARAMLTHGFTCRSVELSTAELDQAQRLFLDYYEDAICVDSQPYDGVWDILPLLYEDGYRLSVCTNKPEDLAVDLLDQLDLAKFFVTICGSDTVSNRKPHPDHLQATAQRAGCLLHHSVMVGDSTPDVEAARNAGIPVIGFDYGYTTTPMVELKPDHLLSSFLDLPKALSQLQGRE